MSYSAPIICNIVTTYLCCHNYKKSVASYLYYDLICHCNPSKKMARDLRMQSITNIHHEISMQSDINTKKTNKRPPSIEIKQDIPDESATNYNDYRTPSHKMRQFRMMNEKKFMEESIPSQSNTLNTTTNDSSKGAVLFKLTTPENSTNLASPNNIELNLNPIPSARRSILGVITPLPPPNDDNKTDNNTINSTNLSSNEMITPQSSELFTENNINNDTINSDDIDRDTLNELETIYDNT